MLIETQAELLDSLIGQHELHAVTETIKRAAYTRVDLMSAGEETYATLGTSRFGGDPDIPINCSWLDRLEGMVFVFQVCLADLVWSTSLGLPPSGMLYVFADEEALSASTFYFPGASDELIRHRMPAPQPDNIFSEMKCLRLKGSLGIDLPRYGSDEFDEIEELGLDEGYHSLEERLTPGDEVFCQLRGRCAELNGDLREDAAKAGGGNARDWRSLWKIFSSLESGLVISDHHVLHGMIKDQELATRAFANVFSIREVV
ncbi:DUF1963 domain-containing protein [Massilia sp. CCM 8733]|uniref:DUF1963 domain-containing protein n=1 Tax=Massilia mucilaginosa TaxID=2609282 RepID=A0ABX0NKZ7_9BURK|nr:DUF1963 domain-containing protein [Massilia mucilaginosa]NHZ87480.1 DUF1963 domain-containing protein [Massilia mucilaginosa]